MQELPADAFPVGDADALTGTIPLEPRTNIKFTFTGAGAPGQSAVYAKVMRSPVVTANADQRDQLLREFERRSSDGVFRIVPETGAFVAQR